MVEEHERRRPHDHLIEPFFGGLDVEPFAPEEPPRARAGWLGRFAAWLRAWWSRPRA